MSRRLVAIGSHFTGEKLRARESMSFSFLLFLFCFGPLLNLLSSQPQGLWVHSRP